jgi:hypothetical protein
MASPPLANEEPGFERDENELRKDQGSSSPDTLEDGPPEADGENADIGTDNDGRNRDDEQPQQGGYQ